MPEFERSYSPRSGELLVEEEDYMEDEEIGGPRRNAAERSVSFNRDVHVKRIGRGSPHVTTALAGDGEGKLIATPVRKESIKARSKEDLAQEAALVLQQADSVDCFAHDPNRKYSSLPTRGRKFKHQHRLDLGSPGDARRRRSEDIAATNGGPPDELVGIPKSKKKALERSASDAGSRKIKQTIVKLFSPKLDRKHKLHTASSTTGGSPAKTLLGRSQSDAGAHSAVAAAAAGGLRSSHQLQQQQHRKRSGSESEGSHIGALRAKKPLSPIIESSPQVLDHQPFNFGGSLDSAKKSKQESLAAKEKREELAKAGSEKVERVIDIRIEDEGAKSAPATVKTVPIQVEELDSRFERRSASPLKDAGVDEVDLVDKSMLHSSRYDQRGDESPIHKMIHRLSNDRSPPPQLTRTMVSPGPGFGHNNNRPFSYTRPNESSPPPPPPQTDVIYAQVQLDKKKAQRSHSDSDEGLGLDRKDSSRENSPAEKEYRRTDYYANDLQRNNEINNFKSRYDAERTKTTTHFGDFGTTTTSNFTTRSMEPKRLHDFDDIDRDPIAKPEKYTSTIFVDTSSRGRADGMDSKRRDSNEFGSSRLINDRSGLSKTSELSARRDLLESRIKSRLLADEMFAAKNNLNLPKKTEHEIIDKPIVPSPVVPNRVASPKRYMDTYISETRTNSNGEKYIFEKEIHEDNGKVYGYEKKITNKIPADVYLDPQPKEGYTVETRTDKYGDKYIVETRTHGGYIDDYKQSMLSDRSRTSPEDDPFHSKLLNGTEKASNYVMQEQLRRDVRENGISSPSLVTRKFGEHSFSKSENIIDDRFPKSTREIYKPKAKKNFEALRGKSKSTQRLDQVGENARIKSSRSEYITRSYENLTSADYVNAKEIRRPQGSPASNEYKDRSPFIKRHLDDLREGPNDDYDTDISQATNSQLESSKYYKETRTTQRYLSSKHGLHDDYDSSPPRIRLDRNGYGSSRYDSDTTARDSLHCESTRYASDLRDPRKEKQHHHNRIIEEDPKKPMRRSRNRLDYLDDSDARDSSRSKSTKDRLETFDEVPQRPPRMHESKIRHTRHETHRGYTERRHHRETRLSDPDRKDRLADSGIENDYRRDSQEADSRREPCLESEDEGFVTMQFIKQERRHTDRNMNGAGDKRRYEKYVMYYDGKGAQSPPLTSKPPTGADVKKYEKKAAKKSGTMSKVKELFRKKEKKAKEEKNKKNMRASSCGALTDDEVTMRYREYRGDQLRSARSARDLESEINEDEYRQRRRLSTPSGSPSPPRPSRLSRSTGTLTRPEQQFADLKNTTLTRDKQGQEAERKGWFKSLSRKNKSSAKPVDKKPRIPESEILTTGTEDEEASSAPERASVQKNLRFFGDTDQESISSNRDRRNKRGVSVGGGGGSGGVVVGGGNGAEDRGKLRREIANSSRHPTGIVLPPRKSSRLAESALSSGESTTGDSSQQSQNSQRSQRSVVYLHAATVGEIPGPNERRRAASREELSRPLGSAHTRTVSRSVSVLAPWRPRGSGNYREQPYEINYDQQQQHASSKPLTTMRRRQRSRETLGRRGKETRRNSKEPTSKTGTINRSTLKSKDKQKVDRTVSTESLASKSRNVSSRPELSRSTSVPRDPNKSAGWFKLKSKKSRA